MRLLQQLFYEEFEAGFNEDGLKGTPFNVHQFSHLFQLRKGPSHLTSCDRYEALYGSLKACYASGTRNLPLQVLKNSLGRDLSRHKCFTRPALRFQTRQEASHAKSSNSVDDSFVFTYEFDARGERKTRFFRIEERSEESVRARELRTEEIFVPDDLQMPDLPWSQVGLCKLVPAEEGDLEFLLVSDIVGKAVVVADAYLVEWPPEWLTYKAKI